MRELVTYTGPTLVFMKRSANHIEPWAADDETRLTEATTIQR